MNDTYACQLIGILFCICAFLSGITDEHPVFKKALFTVGMCWMFHGLLIWIRLNL